VKIAVVGAGAVGCLLGAYLARARHSVELIGRPELVSTVREYGLRIVGPPEQVYRVDVRPRIEPEDMPDVVILTVKTFDLAPASDALARALPGPVPVLLPQNGLGIERVASDALAHGGWTSPSEWTVRAVHSVPATLVSPGVVREGGSGEIILPDPAVAGRSAPRVGIFRDLLEGAGFSVRLAREFEREIWRKALLNAAVNPVTATLGVTNGALLRGPARDRALALLGEARAAARAAGFVFSEEEATIDLDRVVQATATNRSSMLQDLDRGRTTEIDSISGEILRIASEHGVDLPATRKIIDEVRRRSGVRDPRPQP
jgi:2-dehydropantoate 2-reductase